MTQYIDKDALVAEIKRRKEINKYRDTNDSLFEDEAILSFLNSLEVKEVDFEKELDRIWFDNKLGNYFDNDALDFAHVRTICKHFFELGRNYKAHTPSNLDEAADKYVQTLCDRADDNLSIDTTLQAAFKAGAKWMANQNKN